MKASLLILALLATYAVCAVYKIPLNTSVYLVQADLEDSDLAEQFALSNHSTICANISLGTPAQYFNVLLDTASSSFWVAVNDYQGPSGLNSFNTSASTTYYSAPGDITDSDFIYQSFFFNFIADGNVAMDTFQIGKFTYDDAVFGIANFVQSPVSDVDGILGLGFSQINLDSGATTMEQILHDSDFDSASYSLVYSSTSESYLFLGGIESSYVKSDFVYFPLIGNGLWSFIGELTYGTVPLAKNLEFIVDTTSPGFMYLPTVANSNYGDATGIYQGNVHPKDVLRWLRPLNILSHDKELTLSSSGYMACNDEDLCQSVIIEQTNRQNSVILGMGFLELFYTHFDYENNRIGFSCRA